MKSIFVHRPSVVCVTIVSESIARICLGLYAREILEFKIAFFLALFDYVSRAHEIEMCPSSVVRRPLSVIRVAIISEPIEQIPFKFQLWLPLGHIPHGSQNFKTLLLPQITFESFQTFSEYSSQWSAQKYCFGFLKF